MVAVHSPQTIVADAKRSESMVQVATQMTADELASDMLRRFDDGQHYTFGGMLTRKQSDYLWSVCLRHGDQARRSYGLDSRHVDGCYLNESGEMIGTWSGRMMPNHVLALTVHRFNAHANALAGIERAMGRLVEMTTAIIAGEGTNEEKCARILPIFEAQRRLTAAKTRLI